MCWCVCVFCCVPRLRGVDRSDFSFVADLGSLCDRVLQAGVAEEKRKGTCAVAWTCYVE
jgi:hypothetical protein